MTNLQIVKGAIHIAGMLGVQKVVNDVIRNNAIVMSTTDRVLTMAGSLVVGSMIGQQASRHLNEVLTPIMDKFENDHGDSNS